MVTELSETSLSIIKRMQQSELTESVQINQQEEEHEQA